MRTVHDSGTIVRRLSEELPARSKLRLPMSGSHPQPTQRLLLGRQGREKQDPIRIPCSATRTSSLDTLYVGNLQALENMPRTGWLNQERSRRRKPQTTGRKRRTQK